MDSYEPQKADRFTFGLWTVGNPGSDPFGPRVRPRMEPTHIVRRLSECGAWGVNLHDNDLVLPDDQASRHHCVFEPCDDGFKIRDMGSTNGTMVNGSAIQSADLKHGDKITVGEHTLQYLAEKKERAGSYDLSNEV